MTISLARWGKGLVKQIQWKRFFIGLVSIFIFFLLWFLGVLIRHITNLTPVAIPYPQVVLERFFYLLFHPIDGHTLGHHAIASLYRVLLGVVWAFIIGVPVGILTATYSWFDALFKPMMNMLRPIPPIAWIPFAIITFGLTNLSHAFIIFIGAFFPILQNVYDGVKQCNPSYQDVGRSLGASSGQIRWEIILPSITPNIITGMKIALGVGWMCVIAAEMMGIKPPGIGYFINYMKNIGNYANMMAGMLMIGIIGLLLNAIFTLFERKTLRWRGEGE